MAGWMSVADAEGTASELGLKNTASVIELGCPNFPAIFALGAAMDFFSQVGPSAIEQWVRQLADYLLTRLSAAGFAVASNREVDKRSGITLVDVAEPTKVASQLKERDIFVSAKGLGLRVSLYLYNSFEDIDRFVAALTDIAKAPR